MKRIIIEVTNSDIIIFITKESKPQYKLNVNNCINSNEITVIRKALNTTLPKNPFISIPTRGRSIINLAIRQIKEIKTDTNITVSGGAPYSKNAYDIGKFNN